MSNGGQFLSPILDAPICPICDGRGHLDGVDLNYGDTFPCEACSDGVLLACARCGERFTRDSDVVEWLAGRFCCGQCDREVRSDTEAPEAPATIPASQWPEAANDSDLEAGLVGSIATAEAAKDGGIEPASAFRAMRRSAARRVM